MVEYERGGDGDSLAQEIEELRGGIPFSEWKEIVAEAINSGRLTLKEKIGLFGPPIEAFCTDPNAVEVVGTTAVGGVSEGEIRAHVDYVLENENVQTSNMAVGIHVTDMESANKILDEGIREYKESANGKHSIRDGSVFFWIHSTDIDSTMFDHPDGVIVIAPANDVKVSSFMNYELLSSGEITADEYRKNHVMSYTDYVRSVEAGAQASPAHSEDTIF